MTVQEIKNNLKKFDRKQLYKDKVAKMQRSMEHLGVDGIICFKPQNTFFLSGFNPVLYSHPVVVIVPREGDAVLLVHSLRARHSADEAAIDDIRLFGMWANQKPIAKDLNKPCQCSENSITGFLRPIFLLLCMETHDMMDLAAVKETGKSKFVSA